MRIVIATPVLAPQFEALAARYGVETATFTEPSGLLRELGDADALWIWPSFYEGEVATALERHAARLRWVQLPTMGYDTLEEHGVPAGVVVTNAGDAYAPTVAEHALALLLALVRRLPGAIARSAQGAWDQSDGRNIGTLYGATAAVIGFGNIGRAVALRLRGCGARVVAVTRSGRPDPDADEVVSSDLLLEVLARSDAVILAVPLNAATRHLIDAAALAALRTHAIIVNVARGPVIDHAALREALAAGRIGGAGLDVTEPEPLPPDDPLWTLPNALITPHVAGYGGDVAPRRIIAVVERNLKQFLAGAPLDVAIQVPKTPADQRFQSSVRSAK